MQKSVRKSCVPDLYHIIVITIYLLFSVDVIYAGMYCMCQELLKNQKCLVFAHTW